MYMVAPFYWDSGVDHKLGSAYDVEYQGGITNKMVPPYTSSQFTGTFPAKEPQTAIWPRKTNEVTDYTIRCGF
jgi:pyocin large subunit-like protein